MNEKRAYEALEMETIRFASEDVITTSTYDPLAVVELPLSD